MFKKHIMIMALCFVWLILCCIVPFSTMALENNAYFVTLDPQIISKGEMLFYETVSPELAGNPFAADYYPGELTARINGPVIIEDGGTLTIGTISQGNPKEASPVIQGELVKTGLIVVKPGGTLNLKAVTLDVTGEGLLILQEPGGSVNLTDTQINADLVQWAPPQVENSHQKPDDVWLPEGKLLTADMLPNVLSTYLQFGGIKQWSKISLNWDMDNYNRQTDGDLILTGTFQDEDGNNMTSVEPLNITVHWYKPETIAVTDATWIGHTSTSAMLTAKKPSEYVHDVWGEISTDGGKTWEQWDNVLIVDKKDFWTCIFNLPDNAPRHFRIAATDIQEFTHWVSEAVLPSSNTSDQGGNRGGSISPSSPHRTPQPADSPNIEANVNAGHIISDGTVTNATASPTDTDTNAATSTTQTGHSTVTQATVSSLRTSSTIMSGATMTHVSDTLNKAAHAKNANDSRQLHPSLQIILVLGGLGVCIGATVVVSNGISKKKK